MSEKLPSLLPPLVTPSRIPFSVPNAAVAHDASRKHETVEEEPYTIKCVCGFTIDDGTTIYCERCETWQHIECYYPNRVDDALREDFAHACVDCEPRFVDVQQAMLRQKARISVSVTTEVVDKKAAKRPPSKSHKKKPKLTELQLNGHNAIDPSNPSKHASPHDTPHNAMRRPKNPHKSSQSVSSQAPKRSPSVGGGRVSHNPHSHPLSPVTTPPNLPDNVEIHTYSPSFIASCTDPKVQMVKTNSFAGLEVSNNMSEWLRDPAKMQRETGRTYSDVFQNPAAKLEAQPLEIELTKKTLGPNTTLQWQCLRTPVAIAKDVPLIELNGHVGFQSRYCQDRASRWEEFTAPLPFVYFHPMLPLFIDTRREGSLARFVRRSCRPNATLETYLSEGREYHFWLVSDRPIAAKEHITIPWDFRWPPSNLPRMLRILGLNDDEPPPQTEPTVDEAEYQRIAGWVHLVLSAYGGCACNLGQECAFARFHRTYYGRGQARANPPKSKKRKPKSHHNISPTSTGHATTSRAASEGRLEDASLDHDGGSMSGSSRGKPPSRDMTPTARQGSFDQLGILTEPTDRDKRKVSMIEDTFRRMELQQNLQLQPAKKRKRVSDGTEPRARAKSVKSNSAMPTPSLPDGPLKSNYVDAGTTWTSSHSPTSAVSPGHMPFQTGGGPVQVSKRASKPVYVDAAVQTEPERGAWYTEPSPKVMPKKRLVSLTRRLLNNRQRSLREAEERLRGQSLSRRDPTPDPVDLDADTAKPAPGISSSSAQGPEEPENTCTTKAIPTTMFRDDIFTIGAPPIPADHVEKTEREATTLPTESASRSAKSPDVRIQMPPPPPPPPLASGTLVNPGPLPALAALPHSHVATPTPAFPAAVVSTGNLASLAPTPAASGVSIVNPSPVKKKMSLSDWKRVNKTAAARPVNGTATLKTVLDDSFRNPPIINIETNRSPLHEGSVLKASPTHTAAKAPLSNGSDSPHKS